MTVRLTEIERLRLIGVQPQAELARTLPDSRKTMLLGALLIILQALDGILTSVGVSRYSLAKEGNPILRGLMAEFGHVPVLGAVKFAAILLILALCYYAQHLAWVQRVMGAISCVYLFTAVLPWTYILFFQS